MFPMLVLLLLIARVIMINCCKLSPVSSGEMRITGLMHPGLVYARDSTWDFQVYKRSTVVNRLVIPLTTHIKTSRPTRKNVSA